MKTGLILLGMVAAAAGMYSQALNDAGTVFEIIIGLVQLAEMRGNRTFARA